ncbi:MAG: hypothetical protein V2A62_03475 [Candidatus Woesearchaeota archaeon]
MLDEQKIEQSSKIIRELITAGKIVKPKVGMVDFFLNQSHRSLAVAERLLRLYDDERLDTHLWVINTSYYAMFFQATALLALFNHKIEAEQGIHKLTFHALVYYFIKEDNKLKKQLVEEYQDAVKDAESLLQLGETKVQELILDFNSEQVKRKTFTYTTEENAERTKALTSFNRAKNFVGEIDKVIMKNRENKR